MSSNRLQTVGVRLALIFGGVIFACAFMEIGARLFLPPADAKFRNLSEHLVCAAPTGWVGRPNFEGVRTVPTQPDNPQTIRFNSRGFHDTEHLLEKPENLFRILWVGDSFSMAAQVEEPLSAHQQLENLLNERLGSPDRKFEVVSNAVGAWGTAQQLVYYRENGQLYQPDLVLLLFFVGNDVEENLPGHALTLDGYNCFAPYFPLCNGALDTEPWYYIPGLEPAWNSCSTAYKWVTHGLSYIQQNSYLFAQIEPLLLSLKERRMYGQEFGWPYGALYLPEESEELRYGWQVTGALLKQFNREVRANGSDFAMAIIGTQEIVWISQFNEGQLQQFYDTNPLLVDARFDQPHQRLLAILHGQHIPVLDLQPPMIEYTTRSGVQLYFPHDRHWTVEGNRYTAELLAEWLIENKLVNGSK